MLNEIGTLDWQHLWAGDSRLWTGVIREVGTGLGLFYSVVKFFDVVGSRISDDLRASIWVRIAEPPKTETLLKPWSEIFSTLFDRIFAVKKGLSGLFSWKGALRSLALTAVVTCGVVAALYLLIQPHAGFLLRWGIAVFIGSILPDYISIWKTGILLRGARKCPPLLQGPLLLIDLGCSAILGLTARYIGLTISDVTGLYMPWNAQDRLFFPVEYFVIFATASPYLWFYPAFISSAWMVVLIASTFLVRLARRSDATFHWLSKKLDIEGKPVQSIGLVAGAIVAVLFWCRVTIIWLFDHASSMFPIMENLYAHPFGFAIGGILLGFCAFCAFYAFSTIAGVLRGTGRTIARPQGASDGDTNGFELSETRKSVDLRGRGIWSPLAESFRQSTGFEAAKKIRYRRWLLTGVIIITPIAAIATVAYVHIQKLVRVKDMSLPIGLLSAQDSVDSLDIHAHAVDDVSWLSSSRLQSLNVQFSGEDLIRLARFKNLTCLALHLQDSKLETLESLGQFNKLISMSLDLHRSNVRSLTGIGKLRQLTSLSIDLSQTSVRNVLPLRDLKNLTSLTIDAGMDSNLADLRGIEQLKALRFLTLDLTGTRVQSLEWISQLVSLQKLSLKIDGSQMQSLATLGEKKAVASVSMSLGLADLNTIGTLETLSGFDSLSLELVEDSENHLSSQTLNRLRRVKGLTSISLDLGYSGVKSLADISLPDNLASLTINLGDSEISTLYWVRKLSNIESLSIKLEDSGVENLEGISNLKRLTSLSIQGDDSVLKSLKGLERLPALKSLSLSLGDSQNTGDLKVTGLEELGELRGLTSLTLDLVTSPVNSIGGLEKLSDLRSLSLDIRSSKVRNLDPLGSLTNLQSLSISLNASQLESLRFIDRLKALTSLSISVDEYTPQYHPFESLERLTALRSLTLSSSLVHPSLKTFQSTSTALTIVAQPESYLSIPSGYKSISLVCQ